MLPKVLLALLILTFDMADAMASSKNFLHCLGAEEAQLHTNKKDTPLYKLNQELIHALVQLRNTITISTPFTNTICTSTSASLKTLELILTSSNLFQTTVSESQGAHYAIDISSIEQLKTESIFIFVNFLSQTQARLNKSGCLEHHIPELKDFLVKMQFLLEEQGPHKVLHSLKSPDLVFKKLQSLAQHTQVDCP